MKSWTPCPTLRQIGLHATLPTLTSGRQATIRDRPCPGGCPNPVTATQPRKVPKRVYVTLTPNQIGRMLDKVPEDWRPLFACGPAMGPRKGELFALRKADVDLERDTLTVARSHERDTTKTSSAAVLPIPAPLRPWLERQVKHAPGPLHFPAPDGSQRPREADPQKILRSALSRAAIVEGYEHRCRWCGYSERASDDERRFCPTCVKRTDGRGNPLVQPRGRALWPKAIPLPMRFHDLRHCFATELLRRGVDVHRVQRLMRHSDVRVTTGGRRSPRRRRCPCPTSGSSARFPAAASQQSRQCSGANSCCIFAAFGPIGRCGDLRTALAIS